MKSVVVHYQEIALKGNNRPWFIARLARNLREATSDLGVREVRVLMGRIEVVIENDAAWAAVRDRIARVFGVANFAQAGRAPLDVDAIASAILADLGERSVRSFRVSARRADKRFPLSSPEIEREVGGRIKEAKGWLVKLDEYGCLVPGCQLVPTQDISEGKPPGISVSVYPNPVSDMLNVYSWSPYMPKHALLRIVSSSGQVVRESPVTRSDLTSMIPVGDLAAGVYWVQYVEGGVVVATEEAVVAH